MKNESEVFLKSVNEEDGESRLEKSNLAVDFVDAKLVSNQPVPGFGQGMTFGKLFKIYSEDDSLPREVNDVVKFKKWYLENEDGEPKKAA